MPPSILIVDDEPYMLELIETIIRQNTPYQTRTLQDPGGLADLLDQQSFHLVFLDLRMPGKDGMELLREIKSRHPQTEVVIVTAYGTIATAVEAMQQGAANFITKPFEKKELLLTMQRALDWRELKLQNQALRRALAEKYDLQQVLQGQSPRMRELARQAAQLDQAQVPVLLQGEFGTGKSFLARALHYGGPRAGGPLLTLACASLDPGELGRVLFGQGHEPGLLARAAGGTLVLEDLWALPLALQKRLAAFLERGRFQPLDASHQVSSDARLVATCEQDPARAIEEGRADRGLAYQLSGFILRLPPLRLRREDIPLLAQRMLDQFARSYGKEIEGIAPQALEWLQQQAWPGNLRELQSTLERAVLMAGGPRLQLGDLKPPQEVEEPGFSLEPGLLELPYRQALPVARERFEAAFRQRYLAHQLERHQGDVGQAARAAGLEEQEFRAMLAGQRPAGKRH